MEKRDPQGSAPVSGAERSEAEDTGAGRRGRPGRRGVEERTQAVMELLSGKATVDQIAFRFGVRPQVVEKWRETALEGVGQALRQGNTKTAREVELERKLSALERAFTDLAIRHELVERAIATRPSRPGKSPK